MTKQKPIFKKREIVVAAPEKTGVNLGATMKETVAKILYVGEEQTYYKVGDTVLYFWRDTYDKEPYLIKHFGEKLIRLELENQVICLLEDVSI